MIPRYTLENGGIAVVAAVNDDAVLAGSLLRSPEMGQAKELRAQRGFASAAHAYNAGLKASSGEIVVFAHQDVFFPDGWFDSLSQQIQKLNLSDPNWGVLGVFGVNLSGKRVGHIYSTGMGEVLGADFHGPIEASSLDEVVLVVRRSSGLRFDEGLPGFHLYGTDICLQAQARGLKCYVIADFCVHNSNGLAVLPQAYTRALFYMRRKWSRRLPIRTPCMVITRWGVPLMQHYFANWVRMMLNRHQVGKRCADPSVIYRRLAEGGAVRRAARVLKVAEVLATTGEGK